MYPSADLKPSVSLAPKAGEDFSVAETSEPDGLVEPSDDDSEGDSE